MNGSKGYEPPIGRINAYLRASTALMQGPSSVDALSLERYTHDQKKRST
jgi:hypothetical protein